MLPATLLDATRELEADDVMRKALGNTGREDYVDYFVRVKQREFREWHDQVTQWEVDRYLQLFWRVGIGQAGPRPRPSPRQRSSSSPSRPASHGAGSACSSSVAMIASATTLA